MAVVHLVMMTHKKRTTGKKTRNVSIPHHTLKRARKWQRLEHAICKTVSCQSQLSCSKTFLLLFFTLLRPAFARRCCSCLQGWWSLRTGWRVWGAAPPQSGRPQGRVRRWFSLHRHQGAVWRKQEDKQPTFVGGGVFRRRNYRTRSQHKGMVLLCVLNQMLTTATGFFLYVVKIRCNGMRRSN